jgi:competence protein ComEA
MPPAERRALLLLLTLAVAGQGVRHLATRPGQPPGQVQLLATLGAASPLAHRDSAIQRARPLAPGEVIDVDSATAGELARLPKIGLGLAKTIVAYRQEHGAFGSLQGLDRVPGIGPGLLKTVSAHVRFSGAAGQLGGDAAIPPPNTSPCTGPTAPRPICPAAPLDINSASISDLDALPGIGPAKAAAILRYREEHGPFGAVDDLARVPGLGGAAVARLRNRVSAR